MVPFSRTTIASPNIGSEYTEEEIQFLKRMDLYKRQRQRPCPDWAEVLAVLKSLGWRLVEVPGPMPEYQRHRKDGF